MDLGEPDRAGGTIGRSCDGMKIMEKYGKVIAMSAAALGMTAALTVESSMAYFTTYVSAGGSGTVSLGAQTTIHEDQVTDMTKHISVQNTSGSNECFVRVKIFYGGEFAMGFPEEPDSIANEDWYFGDDGYIYYRPVLAPGAVTSVLDAKIFVPEGFDRDNFNVVVIQECTPVVYDESGNASADWKAIYREYQENSGGQGEEADE